MDHFTILVIGMSAVYMLSMALATHTQNFLSALIFKVFPFIFGALNGVIALKMLGIL
jgi:hypothetical protein